MNKVPSFVLWYCVIYNLTHCVKIPVLKYIGLTLWLYFKYVSCYRYLHLKVEKYSTSSTSGCCGKMAINKLNSYIIMFKMPLHSNVSYLYCRSS